VPWHDARVRDTWERRIARADELTRQNGAASPILGVYSQLLRLQRDASAALDAQSDALTGDLAHDGHRVAATAAVMLTSLATIGPPLVERESARRLAADDAALRTALIEGWQSPAPDFVARLALQPYAGCLARAGRRPVGRPSRETGAACPFCGSAPQLSVLRADAGNEGGGRALQCAMCATIWPFRRVLCAHCGEEDEYRLPYFHAADFDHVRVDVCERCHHYLKSIDLTRDGHAVPLVDEVASGALDVWAADRGYQKIEPNLIGL
jgi:FdhE protein